jgi:adenosyl cobinamide kinase/adenosyl cobinamide phosphate guanylyltransferase
MAKSSVYLVIEHISRPIKGVATHKKDQIENPDNWETFENMIIVDSYPNKMLYSASVIIDLMAGKVIKNMFEIDDQQMFKEYVSRYSEEIKDALKTWASKDITNYNKLKDLFSILDTTQGNNNGL